VTNKLHFQQITDIILIIIIGPYYNNNIMNSSDLGPLKPVCLDREDALA
jgi:hypothetical protein